MKMNLVRGTRYVAIGQQNYHIVSQLVRRGKCMQQFINHEAALWPRGESGRGGGERYDNGSRNSSYFPLGHKENENGASNDRKETMQMQIR